MGGGFYIDGAPQMQLTVLVVEDDRDTRDSMQFMLEGEGFAVHLAGNGQEALTVLRQGLRPCVILLDLSMPIMNGFQFREAQLQDRQLLSIPVVVYSGQYQKALNAARLPGVRYFEKPRDLERLLECFNAYCRKQCTQLTCPAWRETHGSSDAG